MNVDVAPLSISHLTSKTRMFRRISIAIVAYTSPLQFSTPKPGQTLCPLFVNFDTFPIDIS